MHFSELPGLTRLLRRFPELAPNLANGVDKTALESLLFAYEIASSRREELEQARPHDEARIATYSALADEIEREIKAICG